uniref:Uncharacterized protein n=1 Tax=viral metagenome TaxID=1070528 RepID=A0A6C0EFE8_9ZZZZ
MKKIGSRKEVYLGIALKTSGGMTRDDIIKSVKDKAKNIYLSKKISSRMKNNNPLVLYRKHKKSKKKGYELGQLNVSDLKEKLIRERQLHRIKRRKLKSLKSKRDLKIRHKSKKLSFALNKNKTKEFYCPSLNREDDMFSTSSLNGYERDNEDEDTENDNYNQNQKSEFKIEEPPDINLDELFI